MFANVLGSGIRLLFPFLNRTLFLWLLGPKYLGLNGLFGSMALSRCVAGLVST